MEKPFQIISFYSFQDMSNLGPLESLKVRLVSILREFGVFGTITIAPEGFNATLCGARQDIPRFLTELQEILESAIEYKSSFNSLSPFRKHEVKIKPEIVTLKQRVDISLGAGTHVDATQWNELMQDPEVFVLDTRNDYEFKTGRFVNAVNPETEKFSDLPAYVASQLDPAKHKKIAMYCTGGIRCEKFAPYMKALGFRDIFQLKGGILKYLEDVPENEQLWQGECYVFDERIALNHRLEKSDVDDLSTRIQNKKSV